MKKLIILLTIPIIFFSGCNKGCTDENACNYDLNNEPCKYSDDEEAMLEGELPTNEELAKFGLAYDPRRPYHPVSYGVEICSMASQA